MLSTAMPLNRVIAFSLMTIVILDAVFFAYSVDHVVTGQITAEIGQSTAILANQMQDKLDRGLYERYREISVAATLLSEASSDNEVALKKWLTHHDAPYTDFAWVGLINTRGDLLASVGQRPPKDDFLVWPSVQAVLSEPERAETAIGRLNIGKGGDGKPSPAQYIDMAVPVIDATGHLKSIVVATIDWRWAHDIGASLFSAGQVVRSTELFVLSDEAEILLGPPSVQEIPAGLGSVRKAKGGANGYAIETWPGGTRYVTGYARSDGHGGFRGFGWIILVRQNAGVALAPVEDMKHRIWILAAFFALQGIVVAWVLAAEIAAPLLRLAKAADGVRLQEKGHQIPLVSNYVEAQRLSKSLISLVEELKSKEIAQAELAASLERQVKDRTEELFQRNSSLEAANARAEEATRAKSRFLAAASHDLRQPLHALLLFSRALRRRITSGEQGSLVIQMEQSIQSLAKMFDALLHISRLDAGGISARTSPMPLKQLLERLAVGFKAEAEIRGLDFRLRGADDIVLTDPVLFETVLRNFLSNAIKFTKAGGVLLCVRTSQHRVVVSVYDTGPGIKPDRLATIFNEFERDKMQADGPNEGLGLGLSIVQRYAKIIDAEVTVQSRIGRGSCFSISVPVMNTFTTNRPIGAPEKTGLSWDKRRVMLLDDNPQVLNALTRDLSDHGAEVMAFPSVETAERALDEGLAADLIIIDYDLSGPETGLSFLERSRLKESFAMDQIILTGRTDSKTLAEIVESGIPWLVKPADSAAIAKCLTKTDGLK